MREGREATAKEHIYTYLTPPHSLVASLFAPLVASLLITEILPPSPPYTINTIPTKGSGLSNGKVLGTGSYLAASIAAANMELGADKRNGNLFLGTSVHLLGEWSGVIGKNDVTQLLVASGALVLQDPILAARLIEQKKLRSRHAKAVDRLILVCDDANTDAKCGLDGDLLKEIQNLIGTEVRSDSKTHPPINLPNTTSSTRRFASRPTLRFPTSSL